MKAIVQRHYGPPDLLALEERERPSIAAGGELLVRVRAASINPVDWHSVTGTPYISRIATGLARPKPTVPGMDFAGVVEAVGRDVREFRPGDEVLGGAKGSLAEYACVPAGRAVRKPANLTFEQAAAVPVAGLSALQALRDKARVQAGQRVLVNGASGGVGTFAVQIARALGAHVTGVCSGGNAELVRSLGAHEVIDYTREDFTRGGRRYDAVIDMIGNHPWREGRRALERRAAYVLVGGPKTNRWLDPVGSFLKLRVASLGASQKVVLFIARAIREDLLDLCALIEAGKVTPVIDRAYPLAEAAEAFRHLATGHARGKIVIAVS